MQKNLKNHTFETAPCWLIEVWIVCGFDTNSYKTLLNGKRPKGRGIKPT